MMKKNIRTRRSEVESVNGCKIFRILRCCKKNVVKEEDVKCVRYIYNKPVFSSSKLGDALDVLYRLAEENYYEDIILIMDLGLLKGRQRFIQSATRGQANNTNGRLVKFDDLKPYITVAEYHGAVSNKVMVENNEFHILHKNEDVTFDSTEEALQRFFLMTRAGWKAELVHVGRNNIEPQFGYNTTVVRTVATASMIRMQDEYNPMKKIEVNRSYREDHKFSKMIESKASSAEELVARVVAEAKSEQ